MSESERTRATRTAEKNMLLVVRSAVMTSRHCGDIIEKMMLLILGSSSYFHQNLQEYRRSRNTITITRNQCLVKELSRCRLSWSGERSVQKKKRREEMNDLLIVALMMMMMMIHLSCC